MSHSAVKIIACDFDKTKRQWIANGEVLAYGEMDGTSGVLHRTTWPTSKERDAHWRGKDDPTGGYRECQCPEPERVVVSVVDEWFEKPPYSFQGNEMFCKKCKSMLGEMDTDEHTNRQHFLEDLKWMHVPAGSPIYRTERGLGAGSWAQLIEVEQLQEGDQVWEWYNCECSFPILVFTNGKLEPVKENEGTPLAKFATDPYPPLYYRILRAAR